MLTQKSLSEGDISCENVGHTGNHHQNVDEILEIDIVQEDVFRLENQDENSLDRGSFSPPNSVGKSPFPNL